MIISHEVEMWQDEVRALLSLKEGERDQDWRIAVWGKRTRLLYRGIRVVLESTQEVRFCWVGNVESYSPLWDEIRKDEIMNWDCYNEPPDYVVGTDESSDDEPTQECYICHLDVALEYYRDGIRDDFPRCARCKQIVCHRHSRVDDGWLYCTRCYRDVAQEYLSWVPTQQERDYWRGVQRGEE